MPISQEKHVLAINIHVGRYPLSMLGTCTYQAAWYVQVCIVTNVPCLDPAPEARLPANRRSFLTHDGKTAPHV